MPLRKIILCYKFALKLLQLLPVYKDLLCTVETQEETFLQIYV